MGASSRSSCLQERLPAGPEVDGTSSLPPAFSIHRWRLATRLRTGQTSACHRGRPRSSSTPIVAKRSAPRRRSARKVAAARPTRPVAAQTRVRYMESSALVAALLERDTAIVKKVSRGTQQVTSALTLAEAGRAIIRARATGRLTPAEEQAACAPSEPSSGAVSSSTLIERCSTESVAPSRSNRSAHSTPCTLRPWICSASRPHWSPSSRAMVACARMPRRLDLQSNR